MQAMTQALQDTIERVILDLGATANAALVLVGDRLGLYRALDKIGPVTPTELAEATGTHERYVREWLAAQAASGYVSYDAKIGRFRMSPEQAMVFADENSPVFMAGGFYNAATAVIDERKLADAFASGEGIAWGEHCNCLFCGVERFFRPGYAHNLVQAWLPALEGMENRLDAGALVADIGCGHGASTLLMAEAYPASRFFGFDYHGPSIERAGQAAAARGLSNVRFETATATDFPLAGGEAYDLVTVFDALHDMGRPEQAAAHVRRRLKTDGAWMIVEPLAGDALEDNLNPVGRVYYAMSTAVCVPTAMSQNDAQPLGAQAGPKQLHRTIAAGGFSRCRIATQTPFNLVLEAKP
jgi:ubiquinone/menaquinone biosynthesis C-methylase UbiE